MAPTTERVTDRGQLLIFRSGERNLLASFKRFHAENPRVYATLCELARKWRRQHPDRPCGIGMLYEVARWTVSLRTTGEPLLLNNSYRSFFARLIMATEPDLANLFRIRSLRA